MPKALTTKPIKSTMTSKACTSCRIRKTKCNLQTPCENCIRHSFACTYNGRPATSQSTSILASRSFQRRPLAAAVTSTSASLDIAQSSGASKQGTDISLIDDYDDLVKTREFYGSSGVLSFLTKIRDKAHQDRAEPSLAPLPDQVGRPASPSLVEYLHVRPEPADVPTVSPSSYISSPLLEQEFIRLYFHNLHLMHPVVDRALFMRRCQRLIWTRDPNPDRANELDSKRPFLAIYNAVLALGAVVAPEDEESMTRYRELDMSGDSSSSVFSKTHRPFDLAELYFGRAKADLGDTFAARSIASTTALLLLSIYCQNALRPHSCYLYCGMAVRMALAVGVASYSGTDSATPSRLWWTLYSHELEMCASAGRPSALEDASSYRIPLPHDNGRTDPLAMVRYMVPFAALVNQILRRGYRSTDDRATATRWCVQLDEDLRQWKLQVDQEMGLSDGFLTDLQWKQKIPLDLRYYNARILLHRPFLPTSTQRSSGRHAEYDHLSPCLEAARSTIRLLVETYSNRPYFRTWWYNTTYLMYAALTVLYVLTAGDFKDETLSNDIETSLTVLMSMNSNVVASRCATIMKQAFDALQAQKNISGEGEDLVPAPVPEPTIDWFDGTWDWSFLDDNMLSDLTGINVMDDFLSVEPPL